MRSSDLARVYTVLSLFAGIGGNLLGMLRARSRRGSRFRSAGAFDIDAAACAALKRLTGATAEPVDIAKLTAAQLRERVPECPDVVFLSAPCKGLSGCLGESLAQSEKYQELNLLGLLAVNLVLEAWWARLDGESEADWIARRRRPKLIFFENVPGIQGRGKELLKQVKALLRAADCEYDERVHDCGELGGLAQRRLRYLLVARHREAAPTPLLKPPPKPLRSMADVLWPLPVPTPGSREGGRMHRLPKLAGINWLRLAAVRAGKDWRDLPPEIVLDWDEQPSESRLGERKQRQSGGFGVNDSERPSHAIVAEGTVRNTWASVADPRSVCTRRDGSMGVSDPAQPSYPIIAHASIHNGPWQIADPRLGCHQRNGALGVGEPSSASATITGRGDVSHPGRAVADPRLHYRNDPRRTSHGVADPNEPSNTIIGKGQPSNTVRAVADPRVPARAQRHAGIHGVMDQTEPARTIIGQARNGKGWAAIADERLFHPTHRLTCSAPLSASRAVWTGARFELVGPPVDVEPKGRPVHLLIEAPDGSVHRPVTTLELAVLQGFPAWHCPGDPTELQLGALSGQWMELDGNDGDCREWIGNAVPVQTGEAMGEQALEVLDAGASEIWSLSSGGIWVEPAQTMAI